MPSQERLFAVTELSFRSKKEKLDEGDFEKTADKLNNDNFMKIMILESSKPVLPPPVAAAFHHDLVATVFQCHCKAVKRQMKTE